MDNVLSEDDVAESSTLPELIALVEQRVEGGGQLPLSFCKAVLRRGAELGAFEGSSQNCERDRGVEFNDAAVDAQAGRHLTSLLAGSLQQ